MDFALVRARFRLGFVLLIMVGNFAQIKTTAELAPGGVNAEVWLLLHPALKLAVRAHGGRECPRILHVEKNAGEITNKQGGLVRKKNVSDIKMGERRNSTGMGNGMSCGRETTAWPPHLARQVAQTALPRTHGGAAAKPSGARRPPGTRRPAQAQEVVGRSANDASRASRHTLRAQSPSARSSGDSKRVMTRRIKGSEDEGIKQNKNGASFDAARQRRAPWYT
ncbi:hypothetical protein C8J57DRAFT_1259423 [Mycena rebaudengoi]|nr:hypothetical protein C8J57DRAFT_1259423 [Mycena rebaudengoi]